MIGVVQPRPAGLPAALTPTGCIAAVIDARRGELFYAFYRQVPGGVQRLATPASARPTTWSPSCWPRREELLLVGDGALRYRERVCEGIAASSSPSSGWPTRRPRSLVQLAHAKALREDWVNPWELEPLYLRKPDAEINWADAGGRDERRSEEPVVRRPTSPGRRPGSSCTCDRAPMRRRHLRGVLRIEQQVYPPAVVARAVRRRARRPDGSRCYVVARVGSAVVGLRRR